VVLCLILVPHPRLTPAEPKPVMVTLIRPPDPGPAPAPPAPHPAPSPAHAAKPAPPEPTPAKIPAPKPVARQTRPKPGPGPHATAPPAKEDEGPPSHPNPALSEAQLAGAATAGSGAGGGPCDMTSHLQEALRRDPLVRSAVSAFAGKAIMVWNGEWVWFQGDIGQGLTAVRQAMEWEIAYAPEACRSKPMHGLVVLSLNEAEGRVRVAFGSGDWRWSDLVTPHDLRR
jgi:hypothetical protein